MSFKNIDTTDILACKTMIDMFVNKVILYDDEIYIIFNTSEDNSQNIKLENADDFTDFEKEISNKKEQSKPNGSDCSSLVHH